MYMNREHIYTKNIWNRNNALPIWRWVRVYYIHAQPAIKIIEFIQYISEGFFFSSVGKAM